VNGDPGRGGTIGIEDMHMRKNVRKRKKGVASIAFHLNVITGIYSEQKIMQCPPRRTHEREKKRLAPAGESDTGTDPGLRRR